MDVTWQGIIFELILLLVLTAINAFFSAIEMAVVALNKNRINYLAEEEENKKAKKILKLLKEPNNFLATIQVGITLAGFLASAFAATTLSEKFSSFLTKLHVPYSDKLSVIIITVLLSYVTLVFGELFPKRIALQKSETISLALINPILFISKLMLPFVKLLSGSTNILLKIFNINIEKVEDEVSEEEIKSMIELGQETGVFNQSEKKMIEGVFKFDDKLAKEVMTPRTEVFVIDINDIDSGTIESIIEEKYSRIPVYRDDIDNIIGILYVKDLFVKLMKTSADDIDIEPLLRTPYFIPENKNIDVLFKELQSTKNHMAILIDEYGGFSGIVTIEDLIEEVMGNIFDEYDDNDQYINKIDQDTYLVSGLVSIDEVNEFLNLELKSDNSDTIGGFVIELLGNIPKEGEENTVEYENIIFKVEKVDEKRIETLKIYIPNENHNNES